MNLPKLNNLSIIMTAYPCFAWLVLTIAKNKPVNVDFFHFYMCFPFTVRKTGGFQAGKSNQTPVK